MSAQEFKVGQMVSGNDYARLPVGTRVEDKYGPALVKVEGDAWRYANDPDAISHPSSDWSDARTIARLPDAPEPEDKADLYVEPEPLKEGDWVQVWAQVVDGRPDGEGEIEIRSLRASDRYYSTYTLPDAIVRPSAGQVPPWLEVERAEAKAISAIKTALVVEGGMHDDRYTQQTAESLYRAGIRATEAGAS
jgi:hypothetical protein